MSRFLDPRVLARVKSLDLIARTVVDGFMAGLHRSPHLGVSTDFAEHRPYMPGDDVRRIDWRLYGRTDRLYVKEFEAETNADVVLLLDVSASMDYGSGELTKLDYARFLTACLAYFSFRQRDRVGLVAFDRDVVAQVPPTGRRLDPVLHTIDRLTPGGAGELATPVERVVRALERRSILILVSDLYEDPASVGLAVGHLIARRHDLIVFQLHDPREQAFDFDAPHLFEDLESGERLPVVPERVREGYRRQLEEHVSEIARVLGESGADHHRLVTSHPLDHALFGYLSRRQRLQRVR